MLDSVKKFIKDNYGRINIDSCEIIFDEKENKYIINCDQPVNLDAGAKQITNGGFKWGTVDEDFDCAYCTKLENLEGAPEEVDKRFDCRFCPNLHSLDGIGKVGDGIISDL